MRSFETRQLNWTEGCKPEAESESMLLLTRTEQAAGPAGGAPIESSLGGRLSQNQFKETCLKALEKNSKIILIHLVCSRWDESGLRRGYKIHVKEMSLNR